MRAQVSDSLLLMWTAGFTCRFPTVFYYWHLESELAHGRFLCFSVSPSPPMCVCMHTRTPSKQNKLSKKKGRKREREKERMKERKKYERKKRIEILHQNICNSSQAISPLCNSPSLEIQEHFLWSWE